MAKLIFADFEWQRKGDDIVPVDGFWYLVEENKCIFRIVKGKLKKIRHISDDLNNRLRRSESC